MSSPSFNSTAAPPSDKRRWNAFVCQDCRAIFRVPADYEGGGVVCPACDRMLRIPRAGESIPTLVQDETGDVSHPQIEPAQIHLIEEVEQEEVSEAIMEEEKPATNDNSLSPSLTGGGRRRKKKQRARGEDLESEWQQRDKKIMLRFSRRVPLGWWWAGAALLLACIVVIVVSMLPNQANPSPIADMPSMGVILPDVVNNSSQTSSTTLQQMVAVREAQEVIKTFLHANSVKAMLPLLRPVKDLENNVTAFYAKHPITSVKFNSIDNVDASSRADQKVVTALVCFSDFRTQLITAIKVDGRYLIDWESWVGWSEMDYDVLMARKPITPVEVRVIVKAESYYNYDFPNSSESEWQSYRLKFIGENQELHGYVKRSSELSSLLTPTLDQGAKPMVLRIRYQAPNSHQSQVLIDSVVADGWVKEIPAN
jgi:hypothetical protein